MCIFFCHFLQQFLILLGGKVQFFIHIRATGAGSAQGLFSSPKAHLFMVAGSKDLRNRPAVPHRGTGVLRIFQQSIVVTLVLKTLRVSQNARDHPAHCVGHRHGRDLTAGEYKITKADFLIHALVDKTLVNALIMTADQNNVLHLA